MKIRLKSAEAILWPGNLGEEYLEGLANRKGILELQKLASTPAELVHVAALGRGVISPKTAKDDASEILHGGEAKTDWVSEVVGRRDAPVIFAAAISVLKVKINQKKEEGPSRDQEESMSVLTALLDTAGIESIVEVSESRRGTERNEE